MNRNLLLTAFLLIFHLIQLRAQDIQFDLSKYKLPDYKRQLLDFNFNVSGNNQMYQYDVDANATNGVNKYSNYSNSFHITYHDFLNATKFQKENLYAFSMNSGYMNQKNGDDDFRNNLSLTPNLNIRSVNRKFSQGTHYTEIDYQVNYMYSHSETEDNSMYFPDFVNTEKEQLHSVFTAVPLKFGNGRIEQVQDARQAVYIIDELDKQHRIEKIITDETIVEFATLISQLKNERYFDYRLQKIHELEAVDSFLRTGNYVNNTDITYFSTLNDFWDYGSNQIRKAGSSFAVAFYPSVNYLYYNYNAHEIDYLGYENTSEGKLNITTLAVTGGLEFTHEKPVSLSFQSGTNASLLLGLMRAIDNEYDDKMGIPNFQINMEQRIGYYPSTRTSFDLFVKGSFINFFEPSDENSEIMYADGIGVNFGSGLNFNYYFSPQFRINATWELNYIWQNSEDGIDMPFNQVINGNLFTSILHQNGNYYGSYREKEFYQSFNIGLVYSFY